MVPPPRSCPSRMPGSWSRIGRSDRMRGWTGIARPRREAAPPRIDREGNSRLTAGASYEGGRTRSAGDQRGHERVVPAGVLALALQARLQRDVRPGEVERHLAQQRQVPGRVALPPPAHVLGEDDVEDPMQSVLHPPM